MQSPHQPSMSDAHDSVKAARTQKSRHTNNSTQLSLPSISKWATAFVVAFSVQFYRLAGIYFLIPGAIALLVGIIVHYWAPTRLKYFMPSIAATYGYSILNIIPI